MSDIVKGLRTYLVSKTVVTSTLASAGDVYYGDLPQGASFPAIVLRKVSSEPQRTLAGAATGRVRTRVQVDVHGVTHQTVETTSQAIEKAVEYFSGTMGTEPVHRAYVDHGVESLLSPVAGDQGSNHVATTDVVLWHKQTLPST